MRRALITAFGLIACAAQAGTQEANFTGPLITPNASALPAGMVLAEPYFIYSESHANYDAQGDRHDDRPGSHQWLLLVPVTLGVTRRFNVQLTGGIAYNVSGGYHSDGARLADTTLTFQYMFVAPRGDGTGPAVSASYAHVFPTGKYDRLGDNPLNATGTGASVDRLAVFAQQLFWLDNGHPLRLRAQWAWSPAPARVYLDGMSAHGTSKVFQGWVKPGSTLGITAAVEYGLSQHWALATDLTWSHQRSGMLQGTDCWPDAYQSVEQRKPVSWSYSIAPAIEYNINGNFGIIAGAQMSFAGHRSASYVTPQIAVNMVF
ncbi:hypothetical protein [Dyella japonica]|uniref:Transporter n=1 Tax=Dyella japonica A8 TaxID=1217721 RepID=A0A075K415_9GAMM|nr:hypothetical protein [Dyella japonica]AIF48442.1 hypothetical protein HY57_14955 [Dyella japonica A8]